MIFKLDTIHSEQDSRDVITNDVLTTADVIPSSYEIPYSFHLNQRAIGICTAISVATVLEKMYGIPFSPQFIYKLGKSRIDQNTYEGSSAKTMLTVVNKYGALPLSLNPYDDTHKTHEEYLNISFTDEQMKIALDYRISYAKARLDPVGFATDLYNSKYGLITRQDVGTNTYTPSWKKRDLEYLRKPTPVTGGHLVLVNKYDGMDENQIREWHNTWGGIGNPTDDYGNIWSDDGNLKYVYKTQAPYITEAWSVLPFSLDIKPVNIFTKDLHIGVSDLQVKLLQQFLNKKGFTVATTGAGSVGKETNYFGFLTRMAVIKYQQSRNIKPTVGYFGPLTRLSANKEYA